MYNIDDTMCWKAWSDLMISLPNKSVKWCCKTSYTKKQSQELKFDADTLDLEFLINHPILQKRKRELSSGIKSTDCKQCWENEAKSGVSTRITSQKQIEYLMLNTRYNKLKKSGEFSDTVSALDLIHDIEIELTNKCNMACVYCWEGLSSRWQKETGKKFSDTDDIVFDKVIDLLNEYWDKKLKHSGYVNFKLQGGEPFFTEHMFEFIERFLKRIDAEKGPRQQIFVNITTNLNFPKQKLDRFIELVKETTGINYTIQASCEATGKQAEIIRWGLNWKNWDSNFRKFLSESVSLNNLHIGIGCSHNSLSIPYFLDFVKYIDNTIADLKYKKAIIYHRNWVDNPEYMSPGTLEQHHIDAVDDTINYLKNESPTNIIEKPLLIENLRNIRAMIGKKTSDNIKHESYEKFTRLEQRRGISFAEHFPHYSELILKPSK